MNFLPESKIEGGLCRISYVPKKDVFNAFKFQDLEGFRKAMDECTESALLEHIAGGKW